MGPLMPNAPAAPAAPLALVELLDRDGQVRQAIGVSHWPLRVGRALDNDVVLSDPHVAAHHLVVDTAAADGADTTGLSLHVGSTINGVLLGHRRLHGDQTLPLPSDGDAVELTVGRTRLRLRLPDHKVAPELALDPTLSLKQRIAPIVVTAALLLAGVLFGAYLGNDPDTFARAAGSTLLGVFVGAAIWCGVWALLSKLFTRQAHFGWHLRVFLYSALALMALGIVPALLAFAFSWPWLTDFAFVAEIGVAAGALYFHLLAVEPARHRMLKWVAATCALVGIGLTLWFNVQRSDRFGDELYMNHLFPPALRLARPIGTDAFIGGLAPLKATLDKKAKEAGSDDGARGEED